MGWNRRDIPDQSGRTAVITGANGGLGFEVARGLAAAGAHVIMAARNLSKAESARAQLTAELGNLDIEVEHLDLASLSSVEDFATRVAANHPTIDLLVNNAGIMATPEGRSEDGFEQQLAVNHLGHFVLTALLLPNLLSAPAARVISVTSTARHIGRSIDPDNPHLTGAYRPWKAYGQSKLANLHFAVELSRRLGNAGASVESLVAHPGLTDSGLQAKSVESSEGGHSQRFFHWLARTTGMSTPRAALPLLRAATDSRARGGQLYAPRFVNFGASVRRPLMGRSVSRRAALRLWRTSERETGTTFDVTAIVDSHDRRNP